MQSSHDCVVKKYNDQVSMCMCLAMTNYGYHGYQHIFVLTLRQNVCMCGVCVLWVPRVPTRFCIKSQYICSTLTGTNGYQVSMCMYLAMTNYGYHG